MKILKTPDYAVDYSKYDLLKKLSKFEKINIEDLKDPLACLLFTPVKIEFKNS